MAALADIREALAAALEPLPDTQVSPWFLANPSPPAIHVYPGPVEYDIAFQRGLDRWAFLIQGFVMLTTDIGGQRRLDRWLAAEGSESVKALVEADKTLGGSVADARVVAHAGYQPVIVEGRGTMLMVEWTTEVIAASS